MRSSTKKSHSLEVLLTAAQPAGVFGPWLRISKTFGQGRRPWVRNKKTNGRLKTLVYPRIWPGEKTSVHNKKEGAVEWLKAADQW